MEQDIFEIFFKKLAKKGFPVEFEGEKIYYEFKNYYASIVEDDILKKIKKIQELLQ